ncbi:hypothetical protein [Pseudomonas sp.]|uniref:hypothetical protein n=1 Tax=Pseudomonas sp. TaxID=306 RepID=UPI00257ED008|nr:hypothetical protein [Pseudomonas sp.]
MPAPENLTAQTPGEPLAAVAHDTTEKQSDGGASPLGGPAFSARHNGGGRWKIWYAPTEEQADWFSDFVVTGEGAKALAEAEAERLNAGGEPFVAQASKPEAAQPAKPKTPSTKAVDATKLKQAVMTPDGWLCPETAQEA